MMYVVQKDDQRAGQSWLSRVSPDVRWGDKRHAMAFDTRALAEMAAKRAILPEENAQIVFVADPGRWRPESKSA
jgi:hypothetical protein